MLGPLENVTTLRKHRKHPLGFNWANWGDGCLDAGRSSGVKVDGQWTMDIGQLGQIMMMGGTPPIGLLFRGMKEHQYLCKLRQA